MYPKISVKILTIALLLSSFSPALAQADWTTTKTADLNQYDQVRYAQLLPAEKTALQTLTDAGAVQMAMRQPVTDGQPPIHTPEGHAAYLPDKGALVFVASNLQPLQPYKTYELWVIPATGQPVPAGIFKPDLSGNASVVMPDIPKGIQAKTFGVTIEDDGGTKQPTMPIVLVGM